MKREEREKVLLKYDHHCAYCGKVISYKEMQVDHIEPHWHTLDEAQAARVNIKKGSHDISNLNPACRRCNQWKSTFSIEGFRKEVQLQLMRLNRDSSNYRMAFDFGMIKEDHKPIVFYFETVNLNVVTQ